MPKLSIAMQDHIYAVFYNKCEHFTMHSGMSRISNNNQAHFITFFLFCLFKTFCRFLQFSLSFPEHPIDHIGHALVLLHFFTTASKVLFIMVFSRYIALSRIGATNKQPKFD